MDKGKYKHCLSSSEPASAVADWTRAGHLTQAHQSDPQRLWNWLQGPEPALSHSGPRGLWLPVNKPVKKMRLGGLARRTKGSGRRC